MRDLTPLFEPRSVALVGASNDRMKWGGWFAISLLGQPGAPRVHMVSRRGGEVFGQQAVPSLLDLDEAPDLAILSIPAAAVEQAVADAAQLGVRAVAVIAAGFGEMGEEGLAVQDRLVATARAADMLLLGPNCLGLLDTHAGLNATGGDQPTGGVSLISQSGNLALEVGLLLTAERQGFARFASVGNQADLTIPDLLWSLVDHEPTRVVTAYVEDPKDGREFVAAVRALAEAGKPPLVIKAGRTDVGARAAQSHTGSLAGEARVFAAALRDAGGIPVATPGELVDRARALLGGARSRGRRVAVLADGGGHGVLAADLLTDAGFELAPLQATTAEAVQPYLPLTQVANPVDLAGAGESDIYNFARITDALVADEGVDAVLYTGYFGGYAGYTDEAAQQELEVARRIAELRDSSGKPLLVQSMQVPSRPPAIAELDALEVPTYARIESAIRGLDDGPRARSRAGPGGAAGARHGGRAGDVPGGAGAARRRRAGVPGRPPGRGRRGGGPDRVAARGAGGAEGGGAGAAAQDGCRRRRAGRVARRCGAGVGGDARAGGDGARRRVRGADGGVGGRRPGGRRAPRSDLRAGGAGRRRRHLRRDAG